MSRSSSPRPSASASRSRRSADRVKAASGQVLVSAVISTYLLTHLHHVLQRAEYAAQQEGKGDLAANYAQLRRLLCVEARSIEAAPALDRGADIHPHAA
ncbi:MAG: hypothetical protein VKK97_03850 [Synechococcaceae cyanobacterium]|nr:hypothetical protein [Synechococcaceae cyanobacterium]